MEALVPNQMLGESENIHNPMNLMFAASTKRICVDGPAQQVCIDHQ